MPKPEHQISFSELSKLAQCEQKWFYHYKEHLKDEGSQAMYLGKIIGECTALMWSGGDWRGLLLLLCTDAGSNFFQEPWETAVWLLERYERHYEGERGTYRNIATELELTAYLPGTGIEVIGFLDQLIEDPNGGLWVLERKTMKDWRRLDWVGVDPQLTIYAWLARENGYEVTGIAFDAIRTYRWKREQRDDHESFQWLWLDRTPEQIEAAVLEIGTAAGVRQALRDGVRKPLHNIGTGCAQCNYNGECFEALAFPTEMEFEDV